jgi:ferredoxin
MAKEKLMDDFLKKRLEKPFVGKVIPVNESLQAQRWVIPSEQAFEILRNASSIALRNCGCRTHYSRCDKPLEVCFFLNKIAEDLIAKGEARRITLSETVDVLRKANENGLVHLTFYMPDQEVFALCSCCSCCCHDLQLLSNRKDLVVRSEYGAHTEYGICISCGKCVDRCVFDARIIEEGRMIYNPDACFGCGLCVTICPVQATVLQPHNK